MPEGANHKPTQPIARGLGQLSLVEHALCPLNTASSLQSNLIHEASYHFTDRSRHMRSAKATILAPKGLTANDEFYLWGLLALTFDQDEPKSEFYATQHFVLRQLGCIDQHSRRGGSAYQAFRESIRRLATVSYENDQFYDPIRGEHREVTFGFFSYSLPAKTESSRAWRFAWDPLFFELCQAAGGKFSFDFSLYSQFDLASRRLLLFLLKIFWRRTTTHWLDVSYLAINVMGYAASLQTKHQKSKLLRCFERLQQAGVIASGGVEWRKLGPGKHQVQLQKGLYRNGATATVRRASDSSLFDPLTAIGFDEQQIGRMLRKHKQGVLEQWADITLAAKEKYGSGFFHKSPQAYFVDNVQAASAGTRTPPDWWHDHRREEWRQRETTTEPDGVSGREQEMAFRQYLRNEGQQVFAEVLTQTIEQFVSEGDSAQAAKQRALPLAHDHMKRRFALLQKKG